MAAPSSGQQKEAPSMGLVPDTELRMLEAARTPNPGEDDWRMDVIFCNNDNEADTKPGLESPEANSSERGSL